MRVSFFCIGIGNGASADAIREAAINAERLGFSGIWAPEHVVLFDSQSSKYPYEPTGQLPLPKDINFYSPFVALTYAASVTTRIRLATGVCLVPERNPIFLAKEIATLDHLSGGRVALGVGIGWSAEEFRAAGVPFERRAARTREYIELMRRLWSEDKTTFSGEFVSVENVRSFPKPVSGAKLPILFGGESDAALKRVASYGTGWFGLGLTPEEVGNKVKQLHRFARDYKREPEELEIIIGPYNKPAAPADLKYFHAAGVQELAVTVGFGFPEKPSAIRAWMEKLASDWVEPAHKLK
ncbi:MAG TPA: LLM class F420-dependent oxidoreductase [Candidatus Binataceae bacterium]|nr:LLM class F420-dependent oxidoreductase [Candidatus Binataceae bacterium]